MKKGVFALEIFVALSLGLILVIMFIPAIPKLKGGHKYLGEMGVQDEGKLQTVRIVGKRSDGNFIAVAWKDAGCLSYPMFYAESPDIVNVHFQEYELQMGLLQFYVQIYGPMSFMGDLSSEERWIIDSVGFVDFDIASNTGNLKSMTVFDNGKQVLLNRQF